jgi:ubiquinone/menaquinone biosynthesis C-methylase UbiE
MLYDAVATVTSVGQWWTWQQAADPLLPKGLLLEVGHGTGRNYVRLAQGGRSVIGLDLSPQMSAIASARIRHAGLSPKLVRADARNLPFAPECFTGVLATFPSEELFHPQASREYARVLAPGGSLVMVIMAWIRGVSTVAKLAAWLYRITGQSSDPEDLELEQLTSGPIRPRGEIVEQPRARVLRLSWIKGRH